MSPAADTVVGLLVLIGAGFVLVGSWGLVRLPSVMERLHAPTKATTLGVGALLLASMIDGRTRYGNWTAHELLVALFLFVTAPVAANMIAKVHLHRTRTVAGGEADGIAGPPPRPDDEGDWATFAEPRRSCPGTPPDP